MDRNEIALKFAVAYLTTPHAPHVVPPWTEPHDVVAREATTDQPASMDRPALIPEPERQRIRPVARTPPRTRTVPRSAATSTCPAQSIDSALA